MAVERDPISKAVAEVPRRLCHQNLSFLRNRRLRRILELAGCQLRFGRPREGEGILVWGASPTAWRGEALAAKTGAPLVRVEDAFVRSLRPGRMGDAPLGLMLDPDGLHFDPSRPSRLERILAEDPLDNTQIIERAKVGMARMRAMELSKYNLHDISRPPPAPGYVLVIDQTKGDASLRASGADQASFEEMLAAARADWPHAPILIRSHPETTNGLRPGHYDESHLRDDSGSGIAFSDPQIAPYALLEGAVAVYTISSQLGFEAILAGHRPKVWGLPFYAGWGLSEDRTPPARRGRKLTRAQLFAGAMILAPLWYDPCRDRLCSFEEMLDQFDASLRAFREDAHGYVATGMRMWKRPRLQEYFGASKALRFADPPAKAANLAAQSKRKLLVWAGKAPPDLPGPLLRLEDGFLRSKGLGAELVPPLSLVCDDMGIYYDPGRPSRLEALLSSPMPPGARTRAARFLEALLAADLTKYNLSAGEPCEIPRGTMGKSIILVPGQVEDDASVLQGGGALRDNLALLAACRSANPSAYILYKPHPDVEAGLRKGATDPAATRACADQIVENGAMAQLLGLVDEVWTITSLTGFEALLRGKKVTTLGAPFYAGWGLTQDLGPVPLRRLRRADGSLLPRPDLLHLVWAALIAYPRYFDPVSRLPCTAECALERLAFGPLPKPGPGNRLLAKLQGRFASQSWLWRP